MRYLPILLIVSMCTISYCNDTQSKIDNLLSPVVMIRSSGSSGSGVVVFCEEINNEYRSFVITNFHVIDDCVTINPDDGTELREPVQLEIPRVKDNGNNTLAFITKGYIVRYDKSLDLAIIEVTDRSLKLSVMKFLPNSIDIKLFDNIWNVGYPSGENINFSEGLITSIEHKISGDSFGVNAKYIRTNAPIYYGSSGGATVLDCQSGFFLVGLSTRVKSSRTPYVNYSIHIDTIRKFLEYEDLTFIESKDKIPRHVKPLKSIKNTYNIQDMFYDILKEFKNPTCPLLPEMEY